MWSGLGIGGRNRTQDMLGVRVGAEAERSQEFEIPPSKLGTIQDGISHISSARLPRVLANCGCSQSPECGNAHCCATFPCRASTISSIPRAQDQQGTFGTRMGSMRPSNPPRISVIPPEQASSTWVPPSAHHRSPGSVSDDDRDDYDPLSHMAHPDCPDSLSCLPDTDGRPQHTLPVILRCAILGSPRKGLTIREIYAAMEEKYAYYRTAGPSWKVC